MVALLGAAHKDCDTKMVHLLRTFTGLVSSMTRPSVIKQKMRRVPRYQKVRPGLRLKLKMRLRVTFKFSLRVRVRARVSVRVTVRVRIDANMNLKCMHVILFRFLGFALAITTDKQTVLHKSLLAPTSTTVLPKPSNLKPYLENPNR